MSKSINLYFQMHQPCRLNGDYNVFCIGNHQDYENEDVLLQIVKKVARRSYIPMLKKIGATKDKLGKNFKVGIGITGLALEFLEKYSPEVIKLLDSLLKKDAIEIIAETYYHSLAFLKSEKEFEEQVELQAKKLKKLFNYEAKTFRNTDLIYNDHLAQKIESLGYEVILAEGTDMALQGKTPNAVYRPDAAPRLKLLLNNSSLADDLALRFNAKDWSEYPLTAEKYWNWIKLSLQKHDLINLFLDMETFGEHISEEEGIIDFFDKLVAESQKETEFEVRWVSPALAADLHYPSGSVKCVPFTSWRGQNRDLSMWIGNPLQDKLLDFSYSLENLLKEKANKKLLDSWRKVLSSDHYHYACTKRFERGWDRRFFSPFESPYEAYMVCINILSDIKERAENNGR